MIDILRREDEKWGMVQKKLQTKFKIQNSYYSRAICIRVNLSISYQVLAIRFLSATRNTYLVQGLRSLLVGQVARIAKAWRSRIVNFPKLLSYVI